MLQSKFCLIERVDGWRGKRYRDAGGDLQKITTEEGSIVRTAARYQYDQVNVAALEKLSQTRDLSAFCLNSPESVRPLAASS